MIKDSTGHGYKSITIYSNVFLEKWKVKLHADFPKILPNPKLKKEMWFYIGTLKNNTYSDYSKSFPFNQTSYDWEYESENTFVFDSLGNNKTDELGHIVNTYKLLDTMYFKLCNNISQMNGLLYGKTYQIFSPQIGVKLKY
jgi:hypothetical protein